MLGRPNPRFTGFLGREEPARFARQYTHPKVSRPTRTPAGALQHASGTHRVAAAPLRASPFARSVRRRRCPFEGAVAAESSTGVPQHRHLATFHAAPWRPHCVAAGGPSALRPPVCARWCRGTAGPRALAPRPCSLPKVWKRMAHPPGRPSPLAACSNPLLSGQMVQRWPRTGRKTDTDTRRRRRPERGPEGTTEGVRQANEHDSGQGATLSPTSMFCCCPNSLLDR